ncbi:MAG: hypothetical protein ACKOC5_04880 [Chloroflexota bacterium]
MIPAAPFYEIRLAEPLDGGCIGWFLDLGVTPVLEPGGPGTLLRGVLPDQAALFGLLARVRNLNLTLLEVRRIDQLSEASHE